MALVADIFLIAAALGATFYCFILSRRLSRFTDLEKGVGGAISVLSAQVDDMTRTLKSAQGAASASASSLGALTGRAEDAARRLELLVASMHDLPPVGQKDGTAALPRGVQSSGQSARPHPADEPSNSDYEAVADDSAPTFVSRRSPEAAE